MKSIGEGGAYVLAPVFNAKRALLRPSRGHLASAVCLFFFFGGGEASTLMRAVKSLSSAPHR